MELFDFLIRSKKNNRPFQKGLLLLNLLSLFFFWNLGYCQTTTYENDFQGWLTDLNMATTTSIDFDDIEGSTTTPIDGDEFSDRPGNPIITLIDGTGIYVGNPAINQIPNPPSGENMLGPNNSGSIEGILKFTFNEPINAIGATFVDVEADFNSTGFSLNIGSDLPEINFTSNQGQGSFAFLGFISDTPFTEVEIHFATGPNIDGTLIDDLIYSLADDLSVDSNFDYSTSVFPNPINNNAKLSLTLPYSQKVSINIIDMYGRKIKGLNEKLYNSGKNTIDIQCQDISNGTYLLNINSPTFNSSHKIMIINN